MTVAANTFLADGKFHHVAVSIRRNAADGIKLYVDGNVVFTGDSRPAVGSLDNAAAFLIGGHAFDSFRSFNGLIDEFEFFKRALTNGEVKAIYDAGSSGKCKPALPLNATAVSSNVVRLSWQDKATTEKGFRIQRKDGVCSSGNPWVTLADKGANNTNLATFLDSPLLAATPYSYQVSTFYGGSSFSAYSACATATTGAAGTTHIPTSLRAVSRSNTRVDLNWNDASENETEFKIYRQAGSGSLTLLDTVAGGIQQYSDMSATGNLAATSYHYDVRACNASGCSMPNTPAVVPFRPTALAASVAATVHLAWKDNSSNESGFEVWRKNGACTTDNPWVVVNKVAANTKAFNDSSAVPTTEYAYKVRAYSNSGILPQTFGYSLFTGCVSRVAP